MRTALLQTTKHASLANSVTERIGKPLLVATAPLQLAQSDNDGRVAVDEDLRDAGSDDGHARDDDIQQRHRLHHVPSWQRDRIRRDVALIIRGI